MTWNECREKIKDYILAFKMIKGYAFSDEEDIDDEFKLIAIRSIILTLENKYDEDK